MRSFLSFSMCFSLVFVLTGCYVSSPKPWGRGYSSYNKEQKSTPGEEARDIGYDFTTEENQAMIESMRPAAQDLVEMLDSKLSFSADKIYLKIPANTTFYNSFDYLLRDEMMKRGYMLSSSTNDAVNIEFVAKEGGVICSGEDDVQYDPTYLALVIDVVDHIPSDFIGGFYNVPLNDYRVAGHVELDVPACALEASAEVENIAETK